MQTPYFKELTTERLLLRALKTEDAPAIAALRSNESVNQFIERATSMSEESALLFVERMRKGAQENQFLYWAITLKEKDELMGTICCWNFSETENCAEVGFELHPDFQKKGITNEALSRLIEFAFEDLKFCKLKAYTKENNKASIALLEKNNFKREKLKGDEANTPANYELIYTLSRNPETAD